MNAPQLILASSSSSRRGMLLAAGVTFTASAPNVDEDLIRDVLTSGGADMHVIAQALAEAKALAISERHPDAFVLGADQLLVIENRIINKAHDENEVRETLTRLSGREHELIAAAVIAKSGRCVWRQTETARLRMRNLSNGFLDAYISAEMPGILSSVGCYHIEGAGAQLFECVTGDQFCIRGLPLFGVLQALRDFGVLRS